MAEKRMFSKKIVKTDRFLEMPQSARLLYYDLSMEADDDGFVDNPRSVMKLTNASQDDLKLLIAKSFLILFPPGLIVIKDWRINNYIQNDRYHPTMHTKEKNQLITNENNSYEVLDTTCIQNGSSDKNRLDKNRLDKINIYCEVISYLNKKAGTHFRDNIDSSRRLIDARLNQGFKVDDFIQVIDIKCDTWLKNKDMKKYLRPETLFGTKFESYLNEATATKSKTTLDDWMEDKK